MRSELLESASGLRPWGAFLFIAIVLSGAGVRMTRTALGGSGGAQPRCVEECDPPPAFDLEDREGRPLARFVQRYDLVLSPNSMWQGHTPRRIAARVAAALEGTLGADDLLARMLPDAESGVVRVPGISAAAADSIELFCRRGSHPPADAKGTIDGLWVQESADGSFQVAWEPAVVLSAAQRERFGLAHRPLAWTRLLADGLAEALDGVPPPPRDADRQARRDAVWARLLPSRHATVVRAFDPARAPEIAALLREEGVSPHQMRLVRSRERIHPFGPMELVGRWGFVDADVAERWARSELGWAPQRTPRDDYERGELTRATWEWLATPTPVAGLERLVGELLSQPEWEFLERDPARFSYETHRAARRPTRAYFRANAEASDTPRVRTTVDVRLQQFVGQALDAMVAEHDLALAQAIVLDLGTGDVLAVDARSPYEIEAFPPVYHAFTPGSTGKLAVMATALELGVVHPEETIDVGQRHFSLDGVRVIHEAESTATGLLTAAETLAHSVNAGLVQIGLRVDAELLRAQLARLHYGRIPTVGLGGERGGFLPKLPWRRNWTHASICFGHEMLTTLWQHAGALSAIVRGGDWRPLRLVDSVAQGEGSWTLPLEPTEPVFRRATARTVRAMMELGAREGTGRHVVGPELQVELAAGTKTGTAQKVGREICLHAELEHQQAHHAAATRCTRACRAELVGRRDGHGSCYTSSMVAYGSLPEARDQELFVLVVGEEPRGTLHYGSQVAGPTAVHLLREALAMRRRDERRREARPARFRPSTLALESADSHPWSTDATLDGIAAQADGAAEGEGWR